MPHMINRLLHSRGSNSNRSFGPANVRIRPCGLPQTSAPIHADVCIDVRIDVRRPLCGQLWTCIWKILRTSAQEKFPACVDLRTKRPNTPQTSSGKCPQFSMRNITFFADISGTGMKNDSSSVDTLQTLHYTCTNAGN